MSKAKSAVKHFRRTGNISEAVKVLKGIMTSRNITEEGSVRSQTQTWYIPDNDALNQFVLRLLNYLPDASYDVDNHDLGFKVTVKGSFADGDISSIAAVKGGVYRLDSQPTDVGV